MCHQSIGLIARQLEAAGIATASLTSAWSITESVGLPRAAFVDYPLGRTAGKAGDPDDQLSIVRAAIQTLTTQVAPRHIVTLPNSWSADAAWREHAMRAGWSSDGLTDVAGPSGSGDQRAARDTSPQWQTAADETAWSEQQPQLSR